MQMDIVEPRAGITPLQIDMMLRLHAFELIIHCDDFAIVHADFARVGPARIHRLESAVFEYRINRKH